MEEIIEEITNTIIDYKNLGNELNFSHAEHLSVMLKDLSSNLFFLEKYRDEYSRYYNESVYNETKKGKSVNASEIIAKQIYPELYMLRRLMVAAYKVQDSIRTNISFLKQERK